MQPCNVQFVLIFVSDVYVVVGYYLFFSLLAVNQIAPLSDHGSAVEVLAHTDDALVIYQTE